MSKGNILLSAGGTGGHLFPAEALAHELKSRGYDVHLATDKRADRFTSDFPATSKTIIQSATMSGRNPVSLIKMAMTLLTGYRHSRQIISEINPLAVVGFGGYPTLPPLMAATRMKVPALLHEQNAVLGRANRLLAKRVSLIATGFQLVGDKSATTTIETGNPVRPMVQQAMKTPYRKRSLEDAFKLVVFGGSQGARFFSKIMPEALCLLTESERKQFVIVQQAREEDEIELRDRYDALGINAEIAPFFRNMPEEIANSDFVIARAGASSVTELAVIGRPSLLVPYPGSLDGDQANNAVAMQEAGGADLVRQDKLSAEKLAQILKSAIDEPQRLQQMATNARKTGIPDAAKRLADCVECVISGGDIKSLSF